LEALHVDKASLNERRGVVVVVSGGVSWAAGRAVLRVGLSGPLDRAWCRHYARLDVTTLLRK
jgi:hypothetical protein